MKNINKIILVLILASLTGISLAQPCATFTSSISNSTVTFTNTSTCGGGTYAFWDFGDGNTANWNNSPVHTYGATGSYWVHLDIRDTSNNLIDTMGHMVTITSLTPIGNCANFTYSFPSSSSPHLVNFVNTSTCPGAASYLWVFGDGDSSNQVSTGHYYGYTGSFCPYLIVYDGNGFPIDTVTHCLPRIVRSTTIQGYVNNYNNNKINVKLTCTLANSTTYIANDIINWGNGTWGGWYGFSVYQELADSSIIKVELLDCDSIVQDTIVMYYHPTISNKSQLYTNLDLTYCLPLQAMFSKAQAIANGNPVPGQVVVTDQSTGNIVGYSWDFGDGNTSTSATPAPHTYAGNGPYVLCLTVSDSNISNTYCDTLSVDSSGNILRRAPGFTVHFEDYTQTGIADIERQRIKLFPNPVSDQLIIEHSEVDNQFINLQITNMNGQLELNKQIQVSGNKTKINVSDLQSGMYMISIYSDRYIFSERLIVE